MKVRVIGDGFGARSLKFILSKFYKQIEIETYIPRRIYPVHLSIGDQLLKIDQLSSPSASWGGLLGIKLSDVDVLCKFGFDLATLKNQERSGLNAYLKVDPIELFNRFRLAEEKFQFLPDDFLSNAEVKEELLDTRHGPVFVCLGVFLTPIFLHNGASKNKFFSVFDNKMMFKGRDYSCDNVVDYASSELQIVGNEFSEGTMGHTVCLQRRVSFREGRRGARAYYGIVSRGVLKHLLDLVNVSSAHSASDLTYSVLKQKHYIRVASNENCNLFWFNGKQLFVRLNLTEDAVSAFHFHNSLDRETQLNLNTKSIFVSDASTLRQLHGLNPVGSILVQSLRLVEQIYGK